MKYNVNKEIISQKRRKITHYLTPKWSIFLHVYDDEYGRVSDVPFMLNMEKNGK